MAWAIPDMVGLDAPCSFHYDQSSLSLSPSMPSSDHSSAEKKKLIEQLRLSLEQGEFIRLTLTGYRGDEPNLNSLRIQLVQLKAGVKLAFTYRYKTKEIVQNFAIANGIEQVQALVGVDYVNARLFTSSQDYQLNYNKRMKPRLATLKPTFPNPNQAVPQTHDRQKQRYIEPVDNVYLKALGITNATGNVTRNREGKFRQINKFVEIIDSLYRSSQLQQQDVIRILDMGSGKGYLTFAVYDFLTYRLGKKAIVTGIEARSELVDFCNATAQKASFRELTFQQGTIQQSAQQPMDIAIALHACDTATDDVIYTSVRAKASIIVLAPCCHKQIRRQVNQSEDMKQLWEFGILLERQAQLVTDRLRSLFLELHGYKTKVFEFIASEHTDKNIMITATQTGKTPDRGKILQQIEQLKQLYGVESYYLEELFDNTRKIAADPLQPTLEELVG